VNPDDNRHMRHALNLAARGLGRVWPNPAVGCVIVKDRRVVGRGHTGDGGRPHAETQALEVACEAARGATTYVTLEPCSHTGETPPCADALIGAGISRVVVAIKDPDQRVSGRGIEKLLAAGIDVEFGCLAHESTDLQRGFLTRISHGRPTLTLKLASTLDGRIATASGESRWITGDAARRMVHAQRLNHDAVLIGAGTARADDPDLTVRGLGADRQPVRIVASRDLRLPEDSRLFKSAGTSPVWIICGEDAEAGIEANRWRDAGARIIPVKANNGQISPTGMLAALGQAGLTRVFCEGGGMLAASLHAADLVDELVVFAAGKIIGAEGQPSIGPLGLAELSAAPTFDLIETRGIGNDIMQRWARPLSAS
jgi:diaminohydroxyphosphoribosylaminopyrimidine deaminase/5-amino-6-(5-phosphoribosylamino)uracil reductase